jgi:hypothetical protein
VTIALDGYVYSMFPSGAISWRAVIAAATMLYVGSTAGIALASAHVRACSDDAALPLGALGIFLTLVLRRT